MANPVEESSCFVMLVYKNGALARQRVRDEVRYPVCTRNPYVLSFSTSHTPGRHEDESYGGGNKVYRFLAIFSVKDRAAL